MFSLFPSFFGALKGGNKIGVVNYKAVSVSFAVKAIENGIF